MPTPLCRIRIQQRCQVKYLGLDRNDRETGDENGLPSTISAYPGINAIQGNYSLPRSLGPEKQNSDNQITRARCVEGYGLL